MVVDVEDLSNVWSSYFRKRRKYHSGYSEWFGMTDQETENPD